MRQKRPRKPLSSEKCVRVLCDSRVILVWGNERKPTRAAPFSSMSPSRMSVDLPEIFTLPPPTTFFLSSTNDAANAGLQVEETEGADGTSAHGSEAA